MITREQIPMVLGNPVRDLNGDKIGEVAQVLLDDATGRPKWLCVKTGLLHTRKTFVPPHKATLTAGHVEVPYDKERVKSAPDVRLEADGHLSAEQERALYRHYDMDWDAAWERANRPGSLTGWAASAGRRERERLGIGADGRRTYADGRRIYTDYAVTRVGDRYGVDDPALGSRDRLDADIPGTRPGEPLGPRSPETLPEQLFGAGDPSRTTSEWYATEDPAARALERFGTGDPLTNAGDRFVVYRDARDLDIRRRGIPGRDEPCL
ncbi:PRC-barrel domain-containing protein [Microbispora hainanensis]|uniref:PRC-barrel domain-containing protein n=1 Tax=Microbispora TaxID=2005 RepID=UPI00115843CB|nr:MULTISPECIES: PRC-barrel domain-containing protein [Microbispora]NJP24984.1 PRC-barrel domain containing protein [Microbispora sp. CL1-1]TQS13914.1 PRC-barrel domain containing protein [Microbispora sp. SCL1-1]